MWNTDNDKIYERPLVSKFHMLPYLPLTEPVKSWNVFYQYLIYRVEAPDENYNYIHIVNLDNENSTLLIEDIFNTYDCRNLLFIILFNSPVFRIQ